MELQGAIQAITNSGFNRADLGILRDGEAQVLSSSGEIGPRRCFEIGSVTKTFTALMVAELVGDDRAAFDRPLAELFPELPAGHWLGERTVLDLLHHRSGLPKNPPFGDLLGAPDRRHAGSEALPRLFTLVPRPASPPGEYSYSNFGYGLLGQILIREYRLSFADLLQERILGPLALEEIRVPPGPSETMVPGHFEGRVEVQAEWSPEALLVAGAGIGASVTGLLDYVRYAYFRPSPLQRAAEACLGNRISSEGGFGAALGWKFLPDEEIYWHDGITGAYRAFLGFRRHPDVAVCLLADTRVDEPKDRHFPGPFDEQGLEMLRRLGLDR